MSKGGIMKRIVSMLARGTGKHSTEFGAEGGPTLKGGTGSRVTPTAGGSTGTMAGDVYSKQEKIQEKE